MLTGGESAVIVAREIVKVAEKEKKVVLKGAIFDGEYYDGEAGVKKLGSFPTKEEAQAKVVTLVLSPARNIMGVVKTLQEKLEKGEAIAKLA
jgi:ribosomal protein L10